MHIGSLIRKVSVIVVVMICFIILRLGIDQMHNYAAATAALEKEDTKNAVMYFGRVMNAYIPFSSLSRKSRDAITALGADFRRRGDLTLAVSCFETVRTSMYLTRHLFLPDRGRLEFLNTEIAAIKAEIISDSGSGDTYTKAYAEQMKIAGRDYSPALLPSVFVVIFFAGYLLSVTVWSVSGRRWSVIAGLFMFILWLTALYLA